MLEEVSVSVDAWLPSPVRSSTPVMVTSWGEFQLVGVNVSSGASMEASEASEPASETAVSYTHLTLPTKRIV